MAGMRLDIALEEDKCRLLGRVINIAFGGLVPMSTSSSSSSSSSLGALSPCEDDSNNISSERNRNHRRGGGNFNYSNGNNSINGSSLTVIGSDCRYWALEIVAVAALRHECRSFLLATSTSTKFVVMDVVVLCIFFNSENIFLHD